MGTLTLEDRCKVDSGRLIKDDYTYSDGKSLKVTPGIMSGVTV
jgi:hypothetical protein